MYEDNEYKKNKGYVFTSASVDALLLCPFYLEKLLISETMIPEFLFEQKKQMLNKMTKYSREKLVLIET